MNNFVMVKKKNYSECVMYIHILPIQIQYYFKILNTYRLYSSYVFFLNKSYIPNIFNSYTYMYGFLKPKKMMIPQPHIGYL